MIWLILSITLAVLIWIRFLKPLDHFTKLGVNQTKPWLIFGDQWKILFRRLSILESIEFYYNMFPGTRYSGFYQFSIPTLIVRDPELLKQLTVKDFDHFTDHRSFLEPEVDPLWAGNLFALKGLKWRDMRATLSGSFTSSKMKQLFHLMNESAEDFVKFFLDKNEDTIKLEMKDTFTRYTNDMIATTAFGIKVDSLKEPNNIFYLMGKQVTDLHSVKRRLKFVAFLVVPKICRFLKVALFGKELSTFFCNTIKETIRVREEKGIVRNDMLNIMIEARKGIRHEESEAIETGFATVKEYTQSGKSRQLPDLTDEVIASQAMVFYLAGFDTVSTAMCFGSYELATNKGIQDKLRKEIVATHKSNNGKLTYDSLLQMNYMDKVISEMLRKWPPAGAVDRVVTKPYTIEPVNADETPVPLNIGDTLLIPIFGIHRDPNNFQNPNQFDPERFSDENKGTIKPYTYIPFGVGPRNCIGSRFALLEIKALLYHLLLNFEIEPTKTTTVPLKLCKKSFSASAEGGFWYGLRRLKQT